MKKITLLVVAAVFVIGIQSCSTEENVFEEETNSKNLVLPGSNPKECITCITVNYPEDMSEATRDTFRNLMRGQVFSTLLKSMDDSCGDIETWDIVNYDELIFNQSGAVVHDPQAFLNESTFSADVKEDDGEETGIPGKIMSINGVTGFRFTLYRAGSTPPPCGGGLFN